MSYETYSSNAWFVRYEYMTVRSSVYDRQVIAPDGQAKVFLLVMTQCNGAIWLAGAMMVYKGEQSELGALGVELRIDQTCLV